MVCVLQIEGSPTTGHDEPGSVFMYWSYKLRGWKCMNLSKRVYTGCLNFCHLWEFRINSNSYKYNISISLWTSNMSTKTELRLKLRGLQQMITCLVSVYFSLLKLRWANLWLPVNLTWVISQRQRMHEDQWLTRNQSRGEAKLQEY